MTARPTVSVIVPFAGTTGELGRLLGDLDAVLVRGPGDELIVADNRCAVGGLAGSADGAVRVVPARGPRAPGYARNCGAAIATGDWLVFIDADTRPAASLLDDYFTPPPRPSTGVLAGGIVDVAASRSAAARHSAARRQMGQRNTLERAGRPYAQTANSAILRSAFTAVGGFAPDIRAGEDADLCFRLSRAGWEIESRPGAIVEHRSRESWGALLVQLAQHGSGAAWLNRRYAGEFPAPSPRALVGRSARLGAAALAAFGRRDLERAQLALLELAESSAFDFGRLLPNRARER
jgi:GT2 family glycosyltransferase